MLFFWKSFFLILHAGLLATTTAKQYQGQCLGGELLELIYTDSLESCIAKGAQVGGATFVTWKPLSPALCQAFGSCPTIDATTTSVTYSLDCKVPGSCVGHVVAENAVQGEPECGQLCEGNTNCTWFTYLEQQQYCLTFNDCNRVTAACTDCHSSSQTCLEETSTSTTTTTTTPPTQYNGCSFDPNSALYTPGSEYSDRNPATHWAWTFLEPLGTIDNSVNLPSYEWSPGGRLSVIKDGGRWYMFYPNGESYRTYGTVNNPGNQEALDPRSKIMGGTIFEDAWNNGGMWLMSVHRTSDTSGNLIGFVHATDRFYNNGFPPGREEYKTVGLACSSDFGATWTSKGRIFTNGPRPDTPIWSGTGDQDVLWDWKQGRWIMFASQGAVLGAAISYDKGGAANSWVKWDGTNFTRTGFEDHMEQLRDTDGDLLPVGANPSVHWNKHLELWVMVYHSWDGVIYISTSSDLPHFNKPRVLVGKTHDNERNYFPSLISWVNGDRFSGRVMTLHYKHYPNGMDRPSFFRKHKLKLCRHDTDNDCPNIEGGAGCSYNPSAPLFTATHPDSNPANRWSWTRTSNIDIVPDVVNWPTYAYMPDGHISTFREPNSNNWFIFYPNHKSYRTLGPSPLPEESTSLNPGDKIMGDKINADVWNNGGQWLMSVQQTDNSGGVTGFVHTEDQFWVNGVTDRDGKAFKSVALACSSDYGRSWDNARRILTLGDKPAVASWSGTGDQDVVWDWKNKRWYMATQMSAAVSYNMNGEQSSWKKWNGTHFDRDSFFQPMETLRDETGTKLNAGANPSIHWNTFLEKWVKVWHGWDGNIYITTASDLPNFSTPKVLIQKSNGDNREKNWYPTLISKDSGDRVGGEFLHLYYRHFPIGPGASTSDFKKTTIRLCRTDPCV